MNNLALLCVVEFSIYIFRGQKDSIFGVCVNLRIKMNATEPLLFHCHKSKKKKIAPFRLVGHLGFKIHESKKIVSPMVNKYSLSFGAAWGLD